MSGLSYFNPRSREGSDVQISGYFYEYKLFQSTLPRRERLWPVCPDEIRVQFQSTLPRRERLGQQWRPADRLGISIHAPAKGATIYHVPVEKHGQFQSTLPRRERLRLAGQHRLGPGISIHAPAKGATKRAFHPVKDYIFQSTLPRRERQHLLTSFRLQYGYFYFISTIKYSSCFKKIN